MVQPGTVTACYSNQLSRVCVVQYFFSKMFQTLPVLNKIPMLSDQQPPSTGTQPCATPASGCPFYWTAALLLQAPQMRPCCLTEQQMYVSLAQGVTPPLLQLFIISD